MGPPYSSETAKCRARLLPFCRGYGADLGCGTIEKIRPEAVGVDARPGLARHVGPIEALPFFRDGSLDYVYSSHALEHLPFPEAALAEWMRTLRRGGRLVLYLPHKDLYRQYNPEHHWNPTPETARGAVLRAAARLQRTPFFAYEYLDDGPDRYSFDLVAQMDYPPPPGPPRVAVFPTGVDGCAYVRARWPPEWAAEGGHAEVRVHEAGAVADWDWPEICVFQRTRDPIAGLAAWRRAAGAGKARVYDTDDDVFRHPDVLGRPYYALDELAAMRAMVAEADLVTCSTPGVAEAMRPLNARIDVVPNGLPPAWFDAPVRRPPGGIRIGFVAAPAHDEDFRLAAPAVWSILRRHPGVSMVFQGHRPAIPLDGIPAAQIVESTWVSFPDLAAVLARLGLDIVLAPWADTPFNRGKSLGKWLDGAWLGAAVVATPLSDYAGLRHGETALLAGTPGEWEAAIEALVSDPDLRRRVAAAARAEARERYAGDVLAPRWADAWWSAAAGRREGRGV